VLKRRSFLVLSLAQETHPDISIFLNQNININNKIDLYCTGLVRKPEANDYSYLAVKSLFIQFGRPSNLSLAPRDSTFYITFMMLNYMTKEPNS
jgi:hypothetical protein